MIEYIDKVIEAGVTSLKIEGRAKSFYYVAVVTNAYRQAVDLYKKDPAHFQLPAWIEEETRKVSHRQYSTGFYFGRPEQGQYYENGGYVRQWDVVAVVDKTEKRHPLLHPAQQILAGGDGGDSLPGRHAGAAAGFLHHHRHHRRRGQRPPDGQQRDDEADHARQGAAPASGGDYSTRGGGLICCREGPATPVRVLRPTALLIDARGRSPLCAPPWRGFQPRTPGDFLMRRKSPKTHQEPPGSWTSSEGGLAPFDPPALCPSGIGCGGLNLQASSGVPLPRHGLTAGSVTPV